jgi:hypothetical protein
LLETAVAVQAFRSFRILRVLMLMKASKTLQQLTYTLVLSVLPSINLCFLLGLMIFMYSIIGMQMFGQIPYGEFINKNDKFNDVFSSSRLLFQIATGQDFMNLVSELSQVAPDAVLGSFTFVCSFYTIVKWVCLNIFVVVLLENFEDNFDTDLMELSQEDLDEFAEIFAKCQDGDAHVLEGFVNVEQVVIELAETSNLMGTIVDREVFWQNRIMFELDMNFEQAPGSMAAMRFDRHFHVEFDGLLLVLVMLSQEDHGAGKMYAGLDYDSKMQRKEGLAAVQKSQAIMIIQVYARDWLFRRATNLKTTLANLEKSQLCSASKAIRLIRINSIVRLNEVGGEHKAKKVLTSRSESPDILII